MNTINNLSVDWESGAATRLRAFPNGTTFLHRHPCGEISVCELIGNLPVDQNWKAQNLCSLQIFYLEDDHQFIVIENLDISLSSVERFLVGGKVVTVLVD